MADHGFAAENSRPGIYDNVVFNGWMAFSGFFFIHLQGAQRHPLVNLDIIADHRGFTDHNTSAVVDIKGMADLGARVNVDAGYPMGVFAHQAG